MIQNISRAVFLVCVIASNSWADEPVIGGPCEGCENVFVGLPVELQPRSRIAPVDEPGEPFVIEGTVRTMDGESVGGIIVYAYQTDQGGVYPPGSTRHGRLRGWARTDEDGNYRFDTIRPGAYPGRSIPQHVHMHVIEPDKGTYYIDDVIFDDDRLLTPARRPQFGRGRGGDGISHPEADAEGVWHVRRDIVLGRNIPGYPCERRWTFPVPFYQSVSWSPDGSKIAFAAVTTSWDEGYRIFTANADGSGLTRLETGGDRDLYPVWSPDGARIAFSSERAGNSDVYVMHADGTRVTRLTHHEAKDNYPSWSPDGSRIVFQSQRDGNYEIYVMNANGTDQVRITDHPADDYNPSWSPDGSRIAFDSDRDEVDGGEIYLISPDGSGLSQVVQAGVFPGWSPDGKELLYSSGGLYATRLDGSDARLLLADAVYGAWSPDGTTIAVASIEYDENCKNHHAVILLDADGSGQRKRLEPGSP